MKIIKTIGNMVKYLIIGFVVIMAFVCLIWLLIWFVNTYTTAFSYMVMILLTGFVGYCVNKLFDLDKFFKTQFKRLKNKRDYI